ncbi:RING finger protein 39-like [Pezoporus occidentalis]|uniref:RING finger protein 39-like n=1 Tax=Pezoporus occidentalis TaxID=407982 RepID=UPI002F90CB06
MAPSVPPERGPLARLARDTLCPACGQPLRDPVLLPCNHSCCRRCLRTAGTPAPPPGPGAALSCPRCHRTAAPHRLRTPVALAVETRIAQRLARGTPAAPRRPQSRSLGAQLRADAAATTTPGPPPPKEPPEGGGTHPKPSPPH